jgi:hypothetical protein
MPIRDHRPLRRSKRLLALLATTAALGTAFLAAPSSAGAYYEEPFCGFMTLWPGGECFAATRHTLQEVQGWSVNSWQRVCAASFSTPYSGQNSDWRCDYGTTLKSLGGRVDGVGAVHNGDPSPFVAVGVQRF